MNIPADRRRAALDKNVALIVGASRGIGLACAKVLAGYGARVVLAARSLETARACAEEIVVHGGHADAVSCDATCFADVQSAVDQCVTTHGRLDILVNNAGVIEPIAHLAQTDPAAWSHAVDVNLKGVYHGLRAALPVMLHQGAGTIVTISSGAANNAMEGWSAYCATKAAVKMLTQCAHKDHGDSGVRVMGLSPGTVATDMMATIKQSGVNPVSQLDWSAHIPPEWAGEAVAFLCTPDAAEFAGTDFSIKTDEGRRAVGLPLVT